MIWLWILGVLVLLIVLFCLSRVGIQARMSPGMTVADVRIGLIRFRVYPEKKKAKREEKQAKKASKSGKKKEKKPRPKIALADIKDAVRTLWPPLKRALNRTRRGIRIHPLDMSVTIGGGENPVTAAKEYGYFHAGMWTAMPLLEKVVDIPDPHIHIGLDFSEPKTAVEGEAGLTARVWTLLTAVLGVGIPALKWFLRWRKKLKQSLPASQPAVSERTESNG